jgi:D-tyrosyl-tRNA(Tyr) deacylase
MKVLVVRIAKGEVYVAEECVASIKKGIAVFVGIDKTDTHSNLAVLAEKIVNLRIFEDEEEKLAYSVKDKGYSTLCIPNFTLCANTAKGRRPSFEDCMPYEEANKLFDDFVMLLKSYGVNVEEGVFGAYMDIRLSVDGPVNIILESDK